ncbi:MAG TPA: hypothetical protein VHE81_17555 [Lacipirellulaceae bacterium]|nr:hypothetical protein [Lacipirellulaceae bacterium]
MCELDPLDPAETNHEGLVVLGPDPTVRLAHRSFGDTFTVTQKGSPRDKAGRQ